MPRLRWRADLGELTIADTEDLQEAQRVLEACGDFHQMLYGQPPTGGEAASLLEELPPGGRVEDKLFALIRNASGEGVGLLVANRSYPVEGEWLIADLMLVPGVRGGGVGARVVVAFLRWIEGQGARAVRLVVQERNPAALRFWTRHGFEVFDHGPQRLGQREHRIARLRRTLSPRT